MGLWHDANVTVTNESNEQQSEECHENNYRKKMVIQMFGLNEMGDSCAIFVEDMSPFFYVLVPSDWTERTKNQFIIDIIKSR